MVNVPYKKCGVMLNIDLQLDVWCGVWVDGQMNELVDGQMESQTNGLPVGWMDWSLGDSWSPLDEWT